MTLEIKKVESKSDLNKFINLVYEIYKGDPNFVAPLKFDRKKLLNKKKNPFYSHSEVEFFLAIKNGKVSGRIGSLVNHNHNKTHNDKVGFFGFFECINDKQVSKELFKSAENHLKSLGMNTVRGPVNPSLNDENALLIDGFDSPPVVLMSYNPKYYINLIEDYGFKKSKDTFAFKLVNGKYRDEKIERLSEAVSSRYKLKIRSVNFKNKSAFKADVNTLKEIYNSAWEPNWGFVKMTDEEFDFLAADLKTIADPDYTLIAESDGKAVGFLLGLPNINEALIHNKSGNLLTGAYHLLAKKKKIEILRIIVLGIVPEFQRKGIDALLYHEIGKRSLPKGIKFGEASWILEDNEMMIKGLTSTMKSEKYKTYRIYEKAI